MGRGRGVPHLAPMSYVFYAMGTDMQITPSPLESLRWCDVSIAELIGEMSVMIFVSLAASALVFYTVALQVGPLPPNLLNETCKCCFFCINCFFFCLFN